MDDAGSLAAFLSRVNSLSDVSDTEALLSRLVGCDHHTVLVAKKRDSLVGYTAVHWIPFPLYGGTEGYISELFIDDSIQGHGIGSRLLSRITEEARARKFFRLMLDNVRSTVSYHRGFYKKQGFVERDASNFVKELK